MSREFFALGNIAIDDLVFADGSTRWCVPGGAAMYAALGTALWTQACSVIAPLGADYPRTDLEHRIDFTQCRSISTTMRNWGLYEDDGSRHFMLRRATADWAAFSPSSTDVETGPYRFCHLAPMPWRQVQSLVRALRKQGAQTISIDVHDRELASLGRGELGALLREVDVFLPSRQDTDVIAPGQTPVAALRFLRELSPGTAVIGVKCGADGAIVHAAGARAYHFIPSAAQAVVDATGAGDAFCGGFLAGFAVHGDSLEGALQGAVSASFALASVGPSALAIASMADAKGRLAQLRSAVELRELDG